MSKLIKDVVFDDELHTKIASGFLKAYNVAKASYGPNAGNALIEYPYGDPLISRDGVTNLQKLVLDDAIENATVRTAVQASKRSDQRVGDGTTASVVLAYHLYTTGRKLVAAGNNQMVVSRQIMDAGNKAVEEIDRIKQELSPKLLNKVAATSSGDPAIGELVAETINKIGPDGGVTFEDFSGPGIFNEIVEGFYFRKGLASIYLATDPTNLESRHTKAPILILDKQLSAQGEAADLMDRIMEKFKELVIIGSVTGDALAFIVQLRLSNKLMVSIVDPPYEARGLFLEDLALMTGATVITEGFDVSEFSLKQLGFAQQVIITTTGTTLLGSDGEKENVDSRVKELQKQLKEASSPVDVEMIRARLSRLTGKVAILRVGGSTETEQKETKLRVVDAVCAAQAAMKEGIVPGGGTVLARFQYEGFTEAFQAPFRQLATNGGFNAEKLLFQLLEAPEGHGFDLRNLTNKPVDLIKAGVIDPALVIKEVALNAASVAAKLLTTSSGITLANRDEKHD